MLPMTHVPAMISSSSPLRRTPATVTALLLAIGVSLTITSSGCRTAPISGRRQLVIIPESQEITLGVQAYEKTLAEEAMSENRQLIEMVNRVGQRIAAAADKPEYDWEFRVIASDTMNAFALPGGKVAIYEGLIPICQDEAGLAVVMSHEVAHAIARHGGERMSQQKVVSGLGAVINVVAQQKTSAATTDTVMKAYGATSKYGVILPYSRKHESEADAIGLILMAKAGYDPSVAPEFWERFSRQTGAKPPELLSTHPTDARRAANLRTLLPEAMNYYKAAPEQLGMGDVLPFTMRATAPQTESPSHAAVAADSPETFLSSSSFAPGPPQSNTVEAPLELPEMDGRPENVQALAATGFPPSPHETFRLPVTAGSLSPLTQRAFRRSGATNRPIDDGWHRANGRP